MSSNLKSYAQIATQIKYFLGVAEPVCSGQVLSALSLVTMTAYPGSVVTNASAAGLWESACEERDYVGVLMKDLGRQVNVYDDNSNLIAVFREIQFVNGAAAEGVPSDYPVGYYVKTWSANGVGVFVARTG